MRTACWIGCIVWVAAACSSPRTGREVAATLSQAMDQMDLRLESEEPFQAYRLGHSIQQVDPDYPGLAERLDQLRVDYAHYVDTFTRPLAGSNYAVREPIAPTLGGRIGWYLPDRLLDLLDVFSFDVHFGWGAFVDVHATRAMQFNAGARAVSGIGWHDHRSLGVQAEAEGAINAVAFGATAFTAALAGTSGVRAGAWAGAGVHGPGDDVYQDYRDYWAVGASATAGFIGVTADLHVLELGDMLVGWATLDPLNDDFAHTRTVRFSSTEKSLLKSLARIAGDEESVANWEAEKTRLDE